MNRWRVVERNYKKFVDNNNQTGRGRKFFEYTEEMEKICGKKKNLHPELLLDSSTVHIPDNNEEDLPSTSHIHPESPIDLEKENKPHKVKRRQQIKKKRLSYQEELRNDRKNYYDKKLKLEERLEIFEREMTSLRKEIKY